MSASNADTGAVPAAPFQSRDLWLALALFLGWTLALCAAMHGYVAHEYFPVADQWALIANSHPAWAHPAQWLSQGFSDYFVYDPAVSQPYADFLRPGFNGAFWLMGWFMDAESGGYLYFVYAVVGLCAALSFLVMRQYPAVGVGPALLLAALLPLMPPLIPEVGMLLVPYGAFDPLGAALALLALLAFARGRWWPAAAALLAAVFTKETSLPVLAALPGLYLLRWWCAPAAGRPPFWPALVLAAPAVLWSAVRLAVFGSPGKGVYVLHGDAAALLRQFLHQALQWPFWLENLPLHLSGMAALQAWLLLLANLGFMSAAFAIVGLRLLRRRQLPHAVEAGLLLSWLFLALVGVADRFGVVLSACLLASLALWRAEGDAPRLSLVAALCLVLGLGVTGWRAVGSWRVIKPLVVEYEQISRRYLAELKTFKPDQTVVVLNDPVSWHSQIRWLRQAGGVEAELVKAADFACPYTSARLHQPCTVGLHAGAAEGQYEFSQSCGIDWCGAFVPHSAPVTLHPAAGVEVELLPAAAATGAAAQWTTLRLRLRHPGPQLLYFDPADRSFHRFDTAAPQAAASPEKSQ